MDLIAIVAGGNPLTWAMRAVERHGAPEAARRLGPSPYVARQCACGIVAHADALAAMGHGECQPRIEARSVRALKASEPLEAQLRCDTCGRTFGLSGPKLTDHTQQAHGRKATNDERTPK